MIPPPVAATAGLDQVCCKIRSSLIGFYMTFKIFAGSNYLDYISALNQVMMMATQLHNDALDPRNHKYAAHQIALFYVCPIFLLTGVCAWLCFPLLLLLCLHVVIETAALPQQTLNGLRGSTKPLRKRIEDRFDEIKGITENSSTPYLGADLQHW